MEKMFQEKRKDIDYLYPITEQLDLVFNPSQFGVFYPENWEEASALDKSKREKEDNLYKEIIKGLETDIQNLGMSLTYSSKIIIRELAMNLVLLGRVKFQFVCRGLLRSKKIMKPEGFSYKKDRYSGKSSKLFSYESYFLDEEEIHPLFERLIPQLEKQINNELKLLGLLPSQLIEREKIVIVKKLRQRYENLCGEISIEARRELN